MLLSRNQFSSEIRLFALLLCFASSAWTRNIEASAFSKPIFVSAKILNACSKLLLDDGDPRVDLDILSDPVLVNDGNDLESTYEIAYNPDMIFLPDELIRFRSNSAKAEILEKGLIIITTPVWVPMATAAALVTKLESPFLPVIFIQERMGQRGKPFHIYKLRTMRPDASGKFYTEKNDPRVTRLGRFFRRWKIDEIFQFLNILKGDMAIVGHRPTTVEQTQAALDKDARYGWILQEKPGLTSLGQTICQHCSTAEQDLEKIRYDLYAMKNKNSKLYLLTLIRTVFTILENHGGR